MPIRTTLEANYAGGLRVLDLAARLPRLRSYVHLSTCYVNINNPPGTVIEER